MNRPALPSAISRVPADQLLFANFDQAGFCATIDGLLDSYDRANEATVELSRASALQPVTARYHVNRVKPNRAKLSPAKFSPTKLSAARALIFASA